MEIIKKLLAVIIAVFTAFLGTWPQVKKACPDMNVHQQRLMWFIVMLGTISFIAGLVWCAVALKEPMKVLIGLI